MSHQSEFGAATISFAAQICVQTAMNTVNNATDVLRQQCQLQGEMAEVMGGVGHDAGSGLIELQYDTQVDAANSAGEGLEAQGEGALRAGIIDGVGAGMGLEALTGFGADACGKLDELGRSVSGEDGFYTNKISNPMKNAFNRFQQALGKNVDLEKDLGSATNLKQELEGLKGKVPENATVSEEQSEQIRKLDEKADKRLSEWKGEASTKGPDFSSYRLDDDNDEINERAFRRATPEQQEQILRHLDNHIFEMKNAIIQNKVQMQNTFTQIISQATQAGAQGVQGAANMENGADTTASQEGQAQGNVYDQANKTVQGQFDKAGSQASNDQQQAIQTLSNLSIAV